MHNAHTMLNSCIIKTDIR